MEKSPTNLQRLVLALKSSLEQLAAQATPAQLEAWAVLVHESMSGYGRNFHSVQHVFDVAEGGGPLQTIAALFHDTVYYQVDGGFSAKQAEILSGVVHEGPDGVKLAAVNAEQDPLLAATIQVFGFSEGQVLSPFAGLNEFLSAVLATRSLNNVLSLAQLIQISACIEATVPFRKQDDNGNGPADWLFERLKAVNSQFELGMSEEELVRTVERATGLANQDVGNFATTDHAWFLDNTWKLLPESNIPFRKGALYTIGEYQSALKKMEGFFSFLDPKVVIRSFNNNPDAETLAEMTSRVKQNVEFGRCYLRAKLVAITLLASIAQKTGGDAPIGLFMGDLPMPGHQTDRLEDFLTLATSPAPMNQEVFKLLAEGRKSDTKFDLRNSPLAAYLYSKIGDPGVKESMNHVQNPMTDEGAAAFLSTLPKDVIKEVATGCAKIAITRKARLLELAAT